jgi:hypothetical protein
LLISFLSRRLLIEADLLLIISFYVRSKIGQTQAPMQEIVCCFFHVPAAAAAGWPGRLIPTGGFAG